MIIPEFLKENNTIAVTAPSDGNKKPIDYIRLENASLNMKKHNLNVIETPDVRTSFMGRSADKEVRAKELMEVWQNDHVKAVISAKGGDFLMEMLPYVDFDVIKNNPKWYQGFSDNTGLTFLITTLCDIVSVYSSNFNDFAMSKWHNALENNLSVLMGNDVVQNSFDMYQDGFIDYETGDESYSEDKPVRWNIVSGSESVDLQGRFIGGCLDVLLNLCGTRFDKVSDYISRYREDGSIWYLETFSLGSEDLERGLWQLKEAGWFDNAKGFIFGRPAFFNTTTDTSFDEAVSNALKGFNVPIITEACIGHKPPQFTMLNGCMGRLLCSNGKGSIQFNTFCR